ncbi:lytic transglycosylase domain-containing protein [Domibacillus sp. DTU_2020_1001157_1_SI_ALB_TIR_016]|uniref:lytic transglycosylase domain-containing protein n=1 Tax=Domibacillus sp. DTU_2020_1001157_1_SI_ALB_TIR_016 TaxID=3077789 RepID=UPI0028EB022C|nr:lytic transglycosylase domain-containing protein [Domibacillus sp. DTU_2020_1001157_1_SI_ALB_TIR_016]WNS79354.1 lytic transglycosylase domain-containing protein [Domibacillus sp. DTU_2020_1001157_1_SI_ALB_TIR_016]
MAKKRRRLKKRAYGCLAIPFLLAAFLLMAIFSITDKAPKFLQSKSIPEEYMPIYKAAAEEYGIPWELLAAHHRVETKFSTMDPMVSPAGAEGPMQFMPCTFVGWEHPTCSGLGKGNIPEEEKTDPAVIAKYGGYGVDANGDGKADPFNVEDAIYSAAHYLSENGAADGDMKRAIFAYNQSDQYVSDILYYVGEYTKREQ